MIVLPAIDLFGGRVVKLDPSTHSTKSRDYGEPEDVARRWLDAGAQHIHVVDLDGAIGTGRDNRAAAVVIQRVALSRGAHVYFGGGVREARVIGEWLNGVGVSRVIVGTRAITDPLWLSLVLKLFKDRLVIAIDAVGGQVVVKGWQETGSVEVVEFVKRAGEWPIGAFLYTNVAVEGRGTGVDWAPVEALLKATSKPVIVAGGIGSVEDVRRFRELGAAGVILGTALYEGRVTLQEAMAAAGGA